MIKRTCTKLLFLALLFCCFCIEQVFANTVITDIRFGEQPSNRLRVVLDLDKTTEYRAFTLSEPYRLVLDMPETTPPQKAISGGKQNIIKEYRHGMLQPGVSRLVFELHKPAKIIKTFILPKEGRLPTRLVIDIEAVTASVFNSHKNTVFGSQDFLSTAYRAPAPPVQRATAPPPSMPTPSPRHKRTVVIDPGHGGNDPGAISRSGIREKDITLAISKELQKQMNATGRYNALLTRDRDIYIPLRRRITIAREAEADLFISIHADSFGKPNVRGFSVYTLSETASDKESARLAERENLSDVIAGIQLEEENHEVANILIDLAMRDTMNNSKMFANMMVHTLGEKGIRLLTNTHRYAGFAVLKAPDVPSVLIETGFLSNDQDAQLLATRSHQIKLAESLRKAIDNYFEKLRSLE